MFARVGLGVRGKPGGIASNYREMGREKRGVGGEMPALCGVFSMPEIPSIM